MPLPTNAGSGENRPRGIPVPPQGRPPRQGSSLPPPRPPSGGYVDDSFEPLAPEEVVEEYYYDERPAPPAPPELPQPEVPKYDVSRLRDEAPATRGAQVDSGAEPSARPPVEEQPEEAIKELIESPSEDGGRKSRRRKLTPEDRGEQPVFIDKKARKLKPYGGAKSKRKDINSYDQRQNRRQKAAMVQFGVLGLLSLLVLFGFYNAVIPKKQLGVDDVNAIIAANEAALSFPIERGESLTEDFLKAYLEVTPEDISKGDPLLGYFYTGTLGGDVSSTMTPSGGFLQRILVAPKVYKVTPITEYSAAFEATALVESYVAPGSQQPSGAAGEGEATGPKWVSYNVNLYYDKDTDTISVTKDSPTLLPPIAIGNGSEIPEEKLPGTGVTNDTLDAEVQSVVFGYLEAFAAASAENHTNLDQYLPRDNKDTSLFRGLNGKYKLDGTPDTAIEYKAYETEDPNVVRVDATVNWVDSIDDLNKATYKSRYLIELEKQDNGQYLVIYMAPRFYSIAEDAS